MQTLILALGEQVQCVGQGVAFRLIGTEHTGEQTRVQLDIGRESHIRHPYLLSRHGRNWYRQGDWLVLAPGIQVCAAGIGRGCARFYVITHSPLRIERSAFTPAKENPA